MKKYDVCMTYTESTVYYKNVQVEAENEEEAKKIAIEENDDLGDFEIISSDVDQDDVQAYEVRE